MLTIAVLCEKGGVGKTTIALALAVAATVDRKKAAVIDTDPQATAANWDDRRESESPWVAAQPVARLRAAIEQARTSGVDVLVIDTAPHAGADAAEVARLADVVVLPFEPHLFALETLSKSLDVIRLAGNPPAFALINKAPTQGSDAQIAADHIKAAGLPVCPTVLHLRAAHRHAANVGKSAAEYEPDGKAAQEIQHVYVWTCQHANRSKRNGETQPAAKRA
jgi:chromosome partitioning protein